MRMKIMHMRSINRKKLNAIRGPEIFADPKMPSTPQASPFILRRPSTPPVKILTGSFFHSKNADRMTTGIKAINELL